MCLSLTEAVVGIMKVQFDLLRDDKASAILASSLWIHSMIPTSAPAVQEKPLY